MNIVACQSLHSATNMLIKDHHHNTIKKHEITLYMSRIAKRFVMKKEDPQSGVSIFQSKQEKLDRGAKLVSSLSWICC